MIATALDELIGCGCAAQAIDLKLLLSIKNTSNLNVGKSMQFLKRWTRFLPRLFLYMCIKLNSCRTGTDW